MHAEASVTTFCVVCLVQTIALAVLKTLRPSNVNILIGQGYTVKEGCSALYDKFQQYLGDSVKLQAAPITVHRPAKASSGKPIRVTYSQGRSRMSGKPHERQAA